MFQAAGALSGLNSLAAAVQPQPKIQGWLTKLGYKSGKWQRRYFRLVENVISYSSDPASQEKGQVILDAGATCEALAPESAVSSNAMSPTAKLKTPVGENAFMVTAGWKGVGKRAFIMMAESPKLRDAWIEAVRATVANPSAGGGPSSPVSSPAAGMPGMSGFDSLGGLGNALAMARGAQALAGIASAPQGTPAPIMPAAQSAPQVTISASGKPLPAFPKSQQQTLFGGAPGGGANLFDMMKTAGAAMSAMKAHQNNPHLSQQDNAAALAQSIQGATGVTGMEQQLVEALRQLERLLPPGCAGFVVTQEPAMGTLGSQYGLAVYDLICGYEGVAITPTTTQRDFGEAKTAAFQTKASFTVRVYSFVTEQQRDVTIMMPPGLPNAVLGIVSSMLPVNAAAAAAAMSGGGGGNIVCKGWIKSGAMYVSSGSNAFPIEGPCTPENANIYVQIFRQAGPGMMVGTGQYHPLYNYTQLAEPLFVEAWTVHGAMLVQAGNKYAPLPMTREHVGMPQGGE